LRAYNGSVKRFALALTFAVAAIGIGLLAMSRTAAKPVSEEGKEPRGYMEYRLAPLRDENGQIPEDGYAKAFRHMEMLAERGPTRLSEANPWQEWGPFNQPGRTRCVLIDPRDPRKMLLATAGGGVWRTVNNGDAWIPIQNYAMNLSVSHLARNPKNPDEIFAATGELMGGGGSVGGNGLYRSTDNGVTWAPTGTAYMWNMNQIDFDSAGNLFIASAFGLYKRDTAGVYTHLLVTDQKVDGWMYGIDVHPGTDLAMVVVGGTNSYRSFDGGKTFQMITGLPVGQKSVAYAPSNPSTCYILWGTTYGKNEARVFRSSDAGATFPEVNVTSTRPNTDFWSNNITVDPLDAAHVFVGGREAWESWDAGVTWKEMQGDPADIEGQAHADVHFFRPGPTFGTDGGLFMCTDGGMYYSTLGANNKRVWRQRTLGVRSSQFYGAQAQSGNNFVFGGTQDNGTHRIQWGRTNSTSVIGADGGMVSVNPQKPENVIMQKQYGEIFRTLDSGETHSFESTGIVTGSGNQPFLSQLEFDNQRYTHAFYAGTVMYRTKNMVDGTPSYGANWQALNTPTAPTAFGLARNNTAGGWVREMWVGDDSGRLYLAADRFADVMTWTTIDDNTTSRNPLPNRRINCVYVDPKNSNRILVGLAGFEYDNLWQSWDRGATWRRSSGGVDNGLPAAPVYSIVQAPNNSEYFHVGTEVGVCYSTNGGQTWGLETKQMIGACIRQLSYFRTFDGQNRILAATHGRGVWSNVPFNVTRLTPNEVEDENEAVKMTLQLSGPAGPSGQRVNLASEDPAYISVPSFVTVPAGKWSVEFNAKIGSAAPQKDVTITTTMGSGVATFPISVTPTPPIDEIKASHEYPVGGKDLVSLEITLLWAPRLQRADFPVVITPPNAGRLTSSAFYVEKGQKKAKLTFQPYQVSKYTQIKVATTQRGVEWGWIFYVQPPALAGVSVSPTTFVGGSATPVTGTVFLPTGDYPAGVKVDVSAYDELEKEFLAPIVVSIPPNQRQASFSIPHSAGPDRTVTLYAQTSNTLTTKFDVKSIGLKSFTLDRNIVTGGSGTPVNMTIELTTAPGVGGADVTITGNDVGGVLNAPATVNIPRGTTKKTVTFYPKSVSLTQLVGVTARLGTSQSSALLQIDRPSVATFTLNRASVVGGSATSVVGTITLNAPAPPGGLSIDRESSDSTVAVLDSIRVEGGKKLVYVPVKHFKVNAATSVKLRAYTVFSQKKEVTLTVNP